MPAVGHTGLPGVRAGMGVPGAVPISPCTRLFGECSFMFCSAWGRAPSRRSCGVLTRWTGEPGVVMLWNVSSLRRKEAGHR